MSDPFTLVYDALWAMLEVHDGFTALVSTSNRIKFSGKLREPIKQNVSTKDLPEVRIVPAGGVPHLQNTSNSSQIEANYEIQIASGDKRMSAALYPVAWEVYRAASKWDTTLRALTWNDRVFVVHGILIAHKEGVSDADLNRGIEGWSAVWNYQVLMAFTTGDLQA